MKKVIIALALIFIGIQFIPVTRTNPEVVSDFAGPMDVKNILKRSCYDCHSNETKWPWYSYVAPASWFVTHHVEEGRAHLNFSNWAQISGNMYLRGEICEEIEQGEMPLESYLLLHSRAKVSEEELDTLKLWAEY